MPEQKLVSLRVDVDTLADAEAVPKLLKILKDYGVKATFFIAMGPDKCGRNLGHYLTRPMRLLEEKPLKRYGAKKLFLSLISPPNVESAQSLKRIIQEGHEAGLHGYDHYRWMKCLPNMTPHEIKETIKMGCRAFMKLFGMKPGSFASPGFKVSHEYLRVLDDFDFTYSSDYIGNRLFYPSIKGDTVKTLQVPVCMKSFRELGNADEVLTRFKKNLGTPGGFFTFYIHPSYEVTFKTDLLKRVLMKIKKDPHLSFCTFSQIAERREILMNSMRCLEIG